MGSFCCPKNDQLDRGTQRVWQPLHWHSLQADEAGLPSSMPWRLVQTYLRLVQKGSRVLEHTLHGGTLPVHELGSADCRWSTRSTNCSRRPPLPTTSRRGRCWSQPWACGGRQALQEASNKLMLSSSEATPSKFFYLSSICFMGITPLNLLVMFGT